MISSARAVLVLLVISTGISLTACGTPKTADKPVTSSTSAKAAITTTTVAPMPQPGPAEQPPSSGTGVSPAGITTSVNAAASSLEEEYYQACRGAADWMADKKGPKEQLVEQYLGWLQHGQVSNMGTFNQTWQALSPDRQAAIIVAANAAAEHQCG